VRPEELHPYTRKLLTNYSLQQAGYPLQADDLLPEEWFDLARIKQAFNPPLICPLIARKKKRHG